MYLVFPSVISCMAASIPSDGLLFWSSAVPRERKEQRKIFAVSPGTFGCTFQFAIASTLRVLLHPAKDYQPRNNIILEYDMCDCKVRRKDSLLRSLCLGRVCLVMLVGVVGPCRRYWKRMVYLSRIFTDYNQRHWLARLVC